MRNQVLDEWNDTGQKEYEIRQVDDSGALLASERVAAQSGEAAAKQLRKVVDGTERIVVCLDGSPMNEMGVSYWKQRVRRR